MEASSSKKQPPLIIFGGLVVILAGGWFGYPYVDDYLQSRPDVGDFQGDATLLDKLKSAKLEAAPTPQAGWPQWRGANRDGISQEAGLLTQWPKEGPPVLWKAKTGAGYSSPAAADGRVILLVQEGDKESVVCWDAETGAERWRRSYPAKFTNAESGVGPHATPTISGDRVFIAGATGMFHCLAVADGAILWSHDLLKEFKVANQEYGVSFSPLVEGELVIVMPGGPGGNSLAAFHRDDGRVVWKAFDDRAGYSSPVAATLAGKPQVVVLTAEWIRGVSPTDGKLLWKHPWPLFKDCNVATPIVAGDYVFISSGYSKGCVLLEISAAADGALQARVAYEHNRMRNHFSTSVLYEDHLYGFDDAFLVCMELRSGKVTWKKRGFGKGTVMVADGRLYVLGESGTLALAAANPQRYQELASCKVLGERCWTMPVLANGKLYVRDEQQILCLNVKP